MHLSRPRPVAHLELHTGDRARACAFYAKLLSGGPMAGTTRWRLIPARANGQLAFGLYARDDKTRTFVPRAVDVITLRGGQILEIVAFLAPDAFRGFDLPATLPEGAAVSGTG
jgi:hypothetical protein